MNIVVVGCGRVGAGLSQALAVRGHTVTVVDNSTDAFNRLETGFKGRTVLGFALDRDLLVEAGIERADGLASVTGSDELNVVVARTASQVFHVPRVVARVYDPGKADIYRRLGIGIISPVTWGIGRLTESLTFRDLEVIATLGSDDVEIVLVEVTSRFEGRKLRDVTVPGQIQIVALKRGDRFQLPGAETLLAAHDVLCLAVVPSAREKVRSLLSLV